MKNTVNVKKDSIKMTAEKKEYCNNLVASAGKNLVNQDPSLEYVGSFTSHLFKKKEIIISNQHEYVTVEHLNLVVNGEQVPEGYCDVAYKQLQHALMKFYGRKIPEKVKR